MNAIAIQSDTLYVSSDETWNEDFTLSRPRAWRVGIWVNGERLAISPKRQDDPDICFERKIDAEMAMAALRREGLVTKESLIEAGQMRVRQIMYEALQW